jgi:hypothetical protein
MQQALELGGGFGWTAQLCDELEVNGFDDWFLPRGNMGMIIIMDSFASAPSGSFSDAVLFRRQPVARLAGYEPMRKAGSVWRPCSVRTMRRAGKPVPSLFAGRYLRDTAGG